MNFLKLNAIIWGTSLIGQLFCSDNCYGSLTMFIISMIALVLFNGKEFIND
tara:strand:+ start:2071 stop:2223 length:153 start_codon:yes stop_codon:yes gene_type:complete